MTAPPITVAPNDTAQRSSTRIRLTFSSMFSKLWKLQHAVDNAFLSKADRVPVGALHWLRHDGSPTDPTAHPAQDRIGQNSSGAISVSGPLHQTKKQSWAKKYAKCRQDQNDAV